MYILRRTRFPLLSSALTISHIDDCLSDAQTQVEMARVLNTYLLYSDEVKRQCVFKKAAERKQNMVVWFRKVGREATETAERGMISKKEAPAGSLTYSA